MNARQRDKYCDYANCSHRVYNEDVLSYDPYYKQIEDYCMLGRYGLEDQEECRCYNCRHFTLSRRDMKKARELKAKIKAESKLYFYSPYEEAKEKEENERFLQEILEQVFHIPWLSFVSFLVLSYYLSSTFLLF